LWLAGGAWKQATASALAGILKGLGSADFGEREAAQGELGKVPAERYDEVRALVVAERDEEVKARLEGR
jgi:hypothetical protein